MPQAIKAIISLNVYSAPPCMALVPVGRVSELCKQDLEVCNNEKNNKACFSGSGITPAFRKNPNAFIKNIHKSFIS